MAVVFYAGHGIGVGKRDFLIPLNARPPRDADRKRAFVLFEMASQGWSGRVACVLS